MLSDLNHLPNNKKFIMTGTILNSLSVYPQQLDKIHAANSNSYSPVNWRNRYLSIVSR